MFHKNILSSSQNLALPLMEIVAKNDYFLVGGTAIALYLGHRKSIDFDLFTAKYPINKNQIIRTFHTNQKVIESVQIKTDEEFTFVSDDLIKWTFFSYPYPLIESQKLNNIKIPSLLDLMAMKAHNIGRRSKWKDYVDLFWALKFHFRLDEINQRVKELLGGEYNMKLFRAQLCYFEDIDYSEEVDFVRESYDKDEIQKFLTEIAIS